MKADAEERLQTNRLYTTGAAAKMYLAENKTEPLKPEAIERYV